jgi:hypothetical protein
MSEVLLDIRAKANDHCAPTTEDTVSPHPVTSQMIDGVISTGMFLIALRRAASDHRLVFQLNQKPLVAPGYHVTEVKSVSYMTMDCGGLANSWRETVIQLRNPGDEPAPEHMTVQKFLAIYERVAKHVPISNDAELRFEYGDAGQPALSYHVQRIEERGELTLVQLKAPIVSCKARDRKNIGRDIVANCCG